MSLEIWLIYVGTVLAFMSTPGPSHVLMLSNSIANGFEKAMATAAGDLSANFLQMLAASIGLVTVLAQFQQLFIYIKWGGVAFLLYLGLKLLVSRRDSNGAAVVRSKSDLYWQGFITSASNPKAIIFFAALFPQFIVDSQPLVGQFFILSITYLFIDGLFLCFYGKFADYFASKIAGPTGRHLNKVAGGLFIAAAGLLGLKGMALQ